MFPRRLCAGSGAPIFSLVKTDDTVETIATLWHGILADAREVNLHWREAHAQLGEVAPEAPEATRLRDEMQTLRDEYARLTEEARHVARDFMPIQGSPRRFDA